MCIATTERLCLRPFEARDLDDLYAYHSDEDVTTYLYWQPRTFEQVRQVLQAKQSHTDPLEGEGKLALAVELYGASKVIGELSLTRLSAEHRQAEIGFVFNPRYGGRGYATEAARALLELGFTKYGFHRIIGRCDARNEASYRLMERLGMRREAHFIENERFKGVWGSELVYAILCREWKAAAAAG